MGEIIGRFHPLVVHLPIGIFILALTMAMASRFKKLAYLDKSIAFILLIGLASSVIALFTGWIMPKEGAYDAGLIQLHFWFAVGMTISFLLVYLSHQSERHWLSKLYLPLFFLSTILLIITGHYGGSLTHGADFLTAPIESKSSLLVRDIQNQLTYEDLIQPILKQKCFSCHNPNKTKGGLLMSTVEGLMKGGDNGPIIIAKDLINSTIIKRIHLPITHKKHMPPKGKNQMTANEVKLLEWWIKEGANFNQKINKLEQSDSIKSILKAYEKASSIDADFSSIKPLEESKINSLLSEGYKVTGLNQADPFINISFARDTQITKKKFDKILKIADNVVELDLSFSRIPKNIFQKLHKFKHLKILKLQGSNVKSENLKNLSKLKYLEKINLYDTKIDDKVFNYLNSTESISEVFLFGSKVTEKSINTYKVNNPRVKISHQSDADLFGSSQLASPLINSRSELFNDTMTISMDANFKGTQIYFTQDNTDPDSTSQLYTQPFIIDQTSQIKAITFKEGWLTSLISEKVFIKAGHKVNKIRLSAAPNPKYKAQGATSLINLKRASNKFSDGQWLGYEAQDLITTLDLGEQKPINNVIVSALEDTGSYIFFPKSITVFTSSDGTNFKKQNRLSIPLAKAPHPSEQKSFLIELAPQVNRYIKLKIEGTLKNPEWHAAPGAKNWFFLDEVMVN